MHRSKHVQCIGTPTDEKQYFRYDVFKKIRFLHLIQNVNYPLDLYLCAIKEHVNINIMIFLKCC